MPQWKWPKRLTEVKLGEKVRYRVSDYWVQPTIGSDGETVLVLYRGEKVFHKMGAGIAGQFAILDTDTPLPTLEAWSENYFRQGVRLLLCSFLLRSKEPSYGWTYVELYTTKIEEARGTEVFHVARRPGVEADYRYFGWEEGYNPARASELLERARTIGK